MKTHIFRSVSIQKFSNYMECNVVMRVIFQLQRNNENQLQNTTVRCHFTYKTMAVNG